MQKIKCYQWSMLLLIIGSVQLAFSQIDSTLWRTYNSPAPGVTFEDLEESFDAYWADRPYVKGKGYKQYQRWAMRNRSRVYPSGDLTLPYTTYENYRAWEKRSGIGPRTRKSVGPQWTELGPFGRVTGFDSGNGRVNMLRVHPQDTTKLYAGTPDGGLWTSSDYGQTWSSNTDHLGAIGVSDLVFDHNDPDIMFLATGDREGDRRSIGVLKSIDAGATWHPTGLVWSATEDQKITRMIMDPNDVDIMLIATNTGVIKTTDGWDSWTNVGPSDKMRDIEFKPGDTNVVYGSSETKFYKSTNAGNSFTHISSGLPSSDIVRMIIAVSPDEPDYVYAICGKLSDGGFLGLYRSTNSGTSWSTRATSPNILGFEVDGLDSGGQAFYDLALTVSPDDADIVTVGGINQWQSTDGGSAWDIISHWIGEGGKPYMHADVHEISHLSSNANTMYTCCDGGIYRSQNGGSTWVDITGNMAISQQNTVGISATNVNRIFCGLQDIGTIETGNSMHPDSLWNLAKGGGGDGEDCFIDRTDDDYIVVTGTNGSHQLSTDGGLSFFSISDDLPQGEFFSAIRQHPTLHDTYLAGGRTHLYRTDDNGDNWSVYGQPFGTDAITEFVVSPADTSVVYATSGYEMAKSTDSGETWTDISAGLPFGDAMASKIATSDTDQDLLWVTFSGYSEGDKVYKSTNGGASWTNISKGLPNVPINTIVYENGTAANNIYIGADYGVFFINDVISTWIPHSNGLPNVQVKDLRIFYGSTPNKIRAATYGRGAWEVDVVTAACNTTIAEVCNDGPCLFASGLYQASDEISFDGLTGDFVIRNDAKVILSSGTSTQLIKSFEVDLGSSLEINTDGCHE